MVSLARKNLLEDIPRFLVAQAGLCLPLAWLQFRLAFSMGLLPTNSDNNSSADIWVASDSLVHLELTLILYKPNPGSTGARRADALIVKGPCGVHRQRDCSSKTNRI